MIIEYLLLSLIIYALLCFSYQDIKYHELGNKSILSLFIFCLASRFILGNFGIILLFSFLFMLILGYVLWDKKAIGGADAKLLSAISPMFPFNGFANMCAVLFEFLIIFLIIGIVYAFIFSKFTTKKKVPFIPCITICFVLLWLFRIY